MENTNSTTITSSTTKGTTDFNIPLANLTEKFNLMQISFDQIEHMEKKEDDIYTGLLYGMPVIVKYMGENNEFLQNLISDLSKYSHPGLAINYGIAAKFEDNLEKIFVVRELILGCNFYSITELKYQDKVSVFNKLVAIYKLVCIFEFLHSFQQYYYFLFPKKIIITKDINVKLIDFMKNNNEILMKIKNSPLNDDFRFIHPLLLKGESSDKDGQSYDLYSIGCLIFYAIFEELPWKDFNSKEDIIAAYSENPSFLKDQNSYGRKEIFEIIEKCLKGDYNDVEDLRNELSELPEIKDHLDNNDKVEVDYEKGKIII
jgi:serine/threonine protein kinase